MNKRLMQFLSDLAEENERLEAEVKRNRFDIDNRGSVVFNNHG